MRKKIAWIMGVMAFSLFSILVQAQNKTMTWTTKSEEAKKLAQSGAFHMVNIEFAQAYDDFKAAVALDPDFTIPLTFLSNITVGATSKDYKEKALKSAANKTEGEKLFASILERDPNATPEANADANRKKWDKLHEMFPDGRIISFYYVSTRKTPAEQLAAAEEMVKKFPEEASFYNTLAYAYLQVKKDTVGAKPFFEKYIKLYPEGCNPYDSMGEYYFDMGDMANSEKYYNMALEKYPFNASSVDKLKEIQVAKDKKKAGN